MSSDEQLELQNFMVNLFHNSDDRSAAIVAASYLEEQLKLAILGHFPNFTTLNKEDKKNLTSGNGPLSTFSARISMAYLLGLINQEQYNELNLIRKIRNGFAHKLDEITFDSNLEIKNRCLNLKLYGTWGLKIESLKDRLLGSVVHISMDLNNYEKWVPENLEDIED